MPHSFGYRARTRHVFRRAFRRHGAPNLSTYLTAYQINDFVDIAVNGSGHKGMPHKYYHGKTGRVFNVNPNSIGVIVNKRVRNRIEPKRIHVRVEHLRQSTCQLKFKEKVKKLEEEKRNNKGVKQSRKRVQPGPREEKRVEVNSATVLKFQNPKFYEEIF